MKKKESKIYGKYKKFYRDNISNNDLLFYPINFLFSILAYLYLRLVFLTSKINYDIKVDRNEIKNNNFVLGFWHGRLLAALMVRKYFPEAKVLISLSRSAYLMKLICQYFKVGRVEGSNNKGGGAGVRNIVKFFKNPPVVLAVAPDGSVGPRMQCSEGIVSISQLTKTPIVLLSFSAKRAKIFQSWDRFFLPYPFNNITVHISEKIDYKHEDGSLKMPGEFRLFIEDYLNKVTWDLDKSYGKPLMSQSKKGRKGVLVKVRNKKL